MNIKYDTLKETLDKMASLHHTLSTMESCTGGGLGSVITNVPGASEVFHFGAITYTNEYKSKMGVDPRIIDKFGVYSVETSKAMAKSICQITGSDIGIGISGNLNWAKFCNEVMEALSEKPIVYNTVEELYFYNILAYFCCFFKSPRWIR